MKKVALILLALLAISAAGIFGKPVYRQLMAKRLVHAAERENEAHHAAEAGRLYTLALEKDPFNLATLRSCAKFLAEAHDPQVVNIEGRLSALQPKDDTALMDYAEGSMEFGSPQQALNLLNERGREADAPIRKDPRFFNLLAICYLSVKQPQLADQAYSKALELAPNEPALAMNQATLRAISSDPGKREAAVAMLDNLSADPAKAPIALAALLQSAAHSESPPAQLETWLTRADALLGGSAAELEPAYLEALKRWRPDQFPAKLRPFLDRAAKHKQSADAAQHWLIDHELYAEDIAFRATLPADFQASFQSLLDAATALAATKDADQLAKLLEDPAWKSAEAVCAAWKEWLRRLGSAEKADVGKATKEEVNWKAVLAKAGGDSPQLSTLVDLTNRWKWPAEMEETLWAAADAQTLGLPEEATKELLKLYRQREDADGYFRVLNRKLQLTPNDPIVSNNAAYMGFLLHRETARSERLAAELCQRDPRSVDYLSTKAFGRLQQGDVDGGLKLLGQVPREVLLNTAPGMTYGWLLAAKGDPDANAFLKDADQWIQFREERKILADARKKLAAQ